MAEIVVDESVVLAASPEAVWDFFLSDAGYALFVGHGPVPGLARVEWLSGNEQIVGSIARAHNTDGSRHRERVVHSDRPRHYEIAIDDFSSPLRLLVREGRERVRFVAEGGATRIDRRFTFTLRSPLVLPIALVVRRFVRRAVQENHERLRARFG